MSTCSPRNQHKQDRHHGLIRAACTLPNRADPHPKNAQNQALVKTRLLSVVKLLQGSGLFVSHTFAKPGSDRFQPKQRVHKWRQPFTMVLDAEKKCWNNWKNMSTIFPWGYGYEMNMNMKQWKMLQKKSTFSTSFEILCFQNGSGYLYESLDVGDSTAMGC